MLKHEILELIHLLLWMGFLYSHEIGWPRWDGGEQRFLGGKNVKTERKKILFGLVTRMLQSLRMTSDIGMDRKTVSNKLLFIQ